jgi:hypothetical protein
MGALVDQLGNKIAGQLIRSEDWNALVVAVEQIGAQVAAVASTLTAQINTVTAQLGQLRSEFDTFRSTTESLLRQYYRVTMQTTKSNYAIGELADIIARVTDLQGQPLDLANAANRPWIDFVTMWGQLKPVPGFISRGGVGDRTISVQVNAEGVAQVRLRADHAEGFSDEDEDEVAGSLKTGMPGRNMTVGEALLQASTPMEAKQSGAYSVLTQEYDRTDAMQVRRYVDAYYLKNPALVAAKITPTVVAHQWRDYRATVLAFAQADGDPRTPDQSRGVSSLQVTFRDWISPWLHLDYLLEIDALRANLRNQLGASIRGTYADSIERIHKQVTEFIQNKGVLGKLRNYNVVYQAMSQLPVPAPPDYLDTLIQNTQSAVSFQQTMGLAQITTVGFAEQEVALNTFTGVSVRAERKSDDVGGRVGTFGDLVDSKVAAAEDRFGQRLADAETRFLAAFDERTRGLDNRFTAIQQTLQEQGRNLQENVNAINVINGRVNATLAEGGVISLLHARVGNVEGQLGALNVLELNADELRQGAQRANLLWALTQGGRGILPNIERPRDMPEPSGS